MTATRRAEVVARFTPDEKAMVRAAAERRGVSMAAYMRMAVLEAIATDARRAGIQ